MANLIVDFFATITAGTSPLYTQFFSTIFYTVYYEYDSEYIEYDSEIITY